MPAVETTPKQHEPMQAVATDERAVDTIISKQPKPEPMPQMESEMSLRGGGFNCGCSERCCGVNCSFYRHCC
ncbi:hypothetical protein QBC42DRAFT_258117 [Cladorrhinum samala]|uniref:Uncharacterized protein n=1 Tax=Cladorrhinum samala TaxID=585594 RepID=A0AAV9I299_9PEZI|nr:hypothetical protein QBC42DRAFT_258117 [Cladorrhinum samala]